MDAKQFEIIWNNLPDLLTATGVTLKITGFSFLVALLIGILVGIARSKQHKLSFVMTVYVEVFRGSPLLIQLFFIYYGLPEMGVTMSAFIAAVMGLGLNGGAYISEIVRAALMAVDRGQEEAAYALGFNRFQTLCYVVLPQAFRIAIPPLVNAFSSMLKDSSLVSVLAITEISRMGQLIYTRTFRAFEIYLVIGLLYLVLTFCVARVSKYVETKMRYDY